MGQRYEWARDSSWSLRGNLLFLTWIVGKCCCFLFLVSPAFQLPLQPYNPTELELRAVLCVLSVRTVEVSSCNPVSLRRPSKAVAHPLQLDSSALISAGVESLGHPSWQTGLPIEALRGKRPAQPGVRKRTEQMSAEWAFEVDCWVSPSLETSFVVCFIYSLFPLHCFLHF